MNFRANVLSFVVLVIFTGGCGSSGGGPLPGATFLEYPVPVAGNLPGAVPPGCWPDDLMGDSQGNIWFAQHHSNEIGRMSATGQYTGFPVLTQRSLMDSIVVDSAHGLVWASQSDGNSLARLDMATGSVTEIPYVRPDASVGDLALDADGNVWLTLGYEGGNRSGGIARLDRSTNQITEIAMPGIRGGFDGLTVGPSGAVWFVELRDNKIGRYLNGAITEYSLPRPGVVPTNIALDCAGAVWVTEQAGNALARMDPVSGAWTEYPLNTPNALPSGIVVDASNNVWFTEFASSKIGLLPAGGTTISEFTIPTGNSGPEDIKVVNGAIWFTEQYGNKIGRITVTDIQGPR